MLMKKSGDDLVSSVAKAFAILSYLAEHQRITLSEAATLLMASKSTALRFIQTLEQMGFIRSHDSKYYTMTFKLFEIGSSVLNYVDFIRDLDPIMQKLKDLLGEAVHLGVVENDTIVYIHKIASNHNLRMASRVGWRTPVYCTALGKAIASCNPELSARMTGEDVVLEPLTPNTIVSKEKLAEELKKIRLQGYSEDNEENELGIHCLACPIFNHMGKAVCAISVSFPVVRFQPERMREYVSALQNAAKEASEILGMHHYPFLCQESDTPSS